MGASLFDEFQRHVERFRTLYRGGKGVAQEELRRDESDGEFLRQASLVATTLAQAEKTLALHRQGAGEHIRFEQWDDFGGDVDFGQVEKLVDSVGMALKEVAKMLPYTKAVSQQHMDYYDSIVKLLETRRNSVSMHLHKLQAERLAVLAKRAAVTRKTHASDTLINPDRNVPLYDDDDKEGAPIFEQYSAEERAQLQAENEELQIQMQEEVVEASESIQRRLGELSQIMTTFSVEINLQKEDMNRIIDTVMHSAVNVELGNSQLLEATNTSADFRFFVLLFLTIMSLSLLFLHWYS